MTDQEPDAVPDYQLYYSPDNASLIIRIILEELGLPYSTELVDRQRDEQQSEAYRALNPNGLIPVCVIDGRAVFETGAIALVLADRHRQLAPHPDSEDRGDFLKWLFFVSNTLQTNVREIHYPEKYAGAAPGDAAQLQAFRLAAWQRIVDNIGQLEAAYAATPGPWLLDNTLTTVDPHIAVCLRWMQMFEPPMPQKLICSDYPALQKMLTELDCRPAVIRACEAEDLAKPFFCSPMC